MSPARPQPRNASSKLKSRVAPVNSASSLIHSDDDYDDNDSEEDADDFDPQELKAVEEMIQRQRGQKKRKNRPEEKEDDDMEDGEDANGIAEDGEAEFESLTEAKAKVGAAAKKKQRVEKEHANNKAGLQAKLSEISLPSSYPWIESLAVTTPTPLTIPDPNDDLQRESQFYTRTTAAVTVALTLLKDANIPFQRPLDYYCEMVKTDAQMDKIKDALIKEKKKMSAVETRKKKEVSLKFAKEVQVKKIQQKHKEKREHMDELKHIRKTTKDSLTTLSEHSTLPGVDEAIASRKKEQSDKRERRNTKREKKDEKYGYGGRKKFIKSNDRESTERGEGYAKSKEKTLFGSSRGGRGGSRGGSRGGGRGGSRGGGVGGRGGMNKNGSTFVNRGSRSEDEKGSGRRGRRSGGKRGGKPNRPGKRRRQEAAGA